MQTHAALHAGHCIGLPALLSLSAASPAALTFLLLFFFLGFCSGTGSGPTSPEGATAHVPSMSVCVPKRTKWQGCINPMSLARLLCRRQLHAERKLATHLSVLTMRCTWHRSCPLWLLLEQRAALSLLLLSPLLLALSLRRCWGSSWHGSSPQAWGQAQHHLLHTSVPSPPELTILAP